MPRGARLAGAPVLVFPGFVVFFGPGEGLVRYGMSIVPYWLEFVKGGDAFPERTGQIEPAWYRRVCPVDRCVSWNASPLQGNRLSRGRDDPAELDAGGRAPTAGHPCPGRDDPAELDAGGRAPTRRSLSPPHAGAQEAPVRGNTGFRQVCLCGFILVPAAHRWGDQPPIPGT